jgi:FolB domain-containing protein
MGTNEDAGIPSTHTQGSNLDYIELRGLRAIGFCGLLPEERDRPQPLECDLDVYVSTLTSKSSDDIEDTVDYGVICADVEAVLSGERFLLLERLANRMAEVVLGIPGVLGVRLVVRKLRPPVPQQLHSSGVGVTRWASVTPAEGGSEKPKGGPR